jgi:hypothetical protein
MTKDYKEIFGEIADFILLEYHNVNDEHVEYIYDLLCDLADKPEKKLGWKKP